jgi:hypothetical protein
MDEGFRKIREEVLKSLEIKLPKRKDKMPLNDRQKAYIKMWKRPLATFTKTCSKCGECYSAGYLKICPKDPEWFCERLEKITPIESPGFTDDELGFYFGITREDLD